MRNRSISGASGLQAWIASNPRARVSLGEVADALGPRGHGLLLLVLTLPNVTIIPSVPLLPFVCGLPAIILCVQMVLGDGAPTLPGWAARLSLSKKTALKVVRPLSWVAGFCHYRMPWMETRTGRALAGILAALLTFVTCLPLPVLDTCPGVGMLLVAVGLAEEDGLVVGLGAAFGIVGFLVSLVTLDLAVAAYAGAG